MKESSRSRPKPDAEALADMGIHPGTAAAVQELAAAGVGEGDFDDVHDHGSAGDD